MSVEDMIADEFEDALAFMPDRAGEPEPMPEPEAA